MKLLRALKKSSRVDFNLPERIEELTWGQGKALGTLDYEQDDVTLKVVSILTQQPEDFWRDSTETNAYIQLAIDCHHLTKEWANDLMNPEALLKSHKIQVGNREVILPDDVGHETVGQYQDCLALQMKWRKSVEQEEEETEYDPPATYDLYEKVFQIYLQPAIDGEYNYSKAMDLDVSHVRYIDVVGWAYFFLIRPTRSNLGTQTNARRVRILWKRIKQGSRRLLRSLAFWSRSTT